MTPKVLNIENLTIDCEINVAIGSIFFHHLWTNGIIMELLSVSSNCSLASKLSSNCSLASELSLQSGPSQHLGWQQCVPAFWGSESLEEAWQPHHTPQVVYVGAGLVDRGTGCPVARRCKKRGDNISYLMHILGHSRSQTLRLRDRIGFEV